LKIWLRIAVNFQFLLHFCFMYLNRHGKILGNTPTHKHSTKSEKLYLLGNANLSLNLVHGKINMVRYT
jgi:hypothetical protein